MQIYWKASLKIYYLQIDIKCHYLKISHALKNYLFIYLFIIIIISVDP